MLKPLSARPSSLFRQNLVLFVVLIAFGQISAAVLFFHFSQRPRIEAFTSIAAHQLVTLRSSLNALDEANRNIVIDRFNAGGALSIATSPPEGDVIHSIGVPGMVLRMMASELDAKGIDMALIGQPARLVAHWHDQSIDYYVTLPELPLAAGSPAVWGSMSILIGLLSLGGALLIEKHLHRPLDDLVAAARQVGRGDVPLRLPEDGPREIAIVARGFNRMVEDLAAIDQERALMLAGVSHDLRTPLTKLRLALGILEGHIEGELADQMIRSIEDMDRLIEQFLDFARSDSDEAVSEVDVGALIAQSLASSGLGRDLMTCQLPPNLMMRGRPLMLRRLFDNVFDNAIKYGRPSVEEPLQVHLQQTGNALDFVCLDHGPGFAEADQARLTRPFVRGRDAIASGTGLGLAIVARIVQRHDGTLELGRRAEGGGAVRISLPL